MGRFVMRDCWLDMNKQVTKEQEKRTDKATGIQCVESPVFHASLSNNNHAITVPIIRSSKCLHTPCCEPGFH